MIGLVWLEWVVGGRWRWEGRPTTQQIQVYLVVIRPVVRWVMGWLGEGVVWGCWEGEVYVTQQIEAHILPSVNKPRNMRCTVGWMKGCGTAWWSGRDFVISTVYLYILWTFWSKRGAMAPAPLATVLVLLSLITGAFFKVMRMKNVTWKIKSTFCRLQTSRDRSIMRLYRALAVSVRHLEFMRRYHITKISPDLEQTYLDGLLCRMSTLSWPTELCC